MSDPGTMMRFAAGNDHGGTIYPAGVAASAAMIEIIDMHPGGPRRTALAVLLDWWAFDPEPGYERFLDENDQVVELEEAVVEVVLAAAPVLRQVASDQRDAVAARLAADLEVCAQHGWGSFVHEGRVENRRA